MRTSISLLATLATVQIAAAEPVADSPLVAAVAARDYTKISALLKAGSSPDGPEMASSTPLTKACSRSDLRAIQLLITAGADVNLRNAHGSTPLYIAVTRDEPSTAIVSALLSAGADPDTSCSHGYTPASHCASKDHHAALRLLLRHGAIAVGVTNYKAGLREWDQVYNRSTRSWPYAAIHFGTSRATHYQVTASFGDESDEILNRHYTANPPPSVAGQITGID